MDRIWHEIEGTELSQEFYDTADKLLSKLASKVVLNIDYTSLVKNADKNKKLKVNHLGIGDSTIWQGIPDTRVQT